MLDDIRIYNRALTAAEVSQLYSKESGQPNTVLVQGGTLPAGSALAGQAVAPFQIARFETTWAEWKAVRTWALANGYTFDKPGLDEEEQLATQTTVGELLRNLDRYKIYVDYYKDTTPVWKSSYSEGEEVDLDSLIEDVKSADPRSEDSRRACRGVVKQLYYRAFKSKRIIQFRDLEDLKSEKLQELKNAVIKCDEDKNFVEGSLGVRDELKSLYSCYQSGRDKRERHGISKYCLTGYMEKVQNTPGMQRESIVKKHILNAINSKKKDVMVESILRQIKNTRR
jgi:hypothetical protein